MSTSGEPESPGIETAGLALKACPTITHMADDTHAVGASAAGLRKAICSSLYQLADTAAEFVGIFFRRTDARREPQYLPPRVAVQLPGT